MQFSPVLLNEQLFTQQHNSCNRQPVALSHYFQDVHYKWSGLFRALKKIKIKISEFSTPYKESWEQCQCHSFNQSYITEKNGNVFCQ